MECIWKSMLSNIDKNIYTNLKDMILASLTDHYFLSNRVFLPFPQIIPSALFIKGKKKKKVQV